MKRKRRRYEQFARWMVRVGADINPAIYCHWDCDSLRTPDGTYCFGLLSFGAHETPTIHIAAKMMRTQEVMRTLAHEWAHFLQFQDGELDGDLAGKDAETPAEEFSAWAVSAYKAYLKRKRHHQPPFALRSLACHAGGV